MPAQLESCVKQMEAQVKSEQSAYAICQASLDQAVKTCISIRDGYQEYAGAEIGAEPAYQMFKIYRRPETVKQCMGAMDGLPIIAGHVDPEKDLDESLVIGRVESSELVEEPNEETGQTCYVKHVVSLSEKALELIAEGIKELSLGYIGKLVEHEKYDAEQINIRPHHLAIVENGRCGDTCRFTDKKIEGENMKKKQKFFDAEGPNMKAIVELAAQVAEAITQLPIDTLKKVVPTLTMIVETAKSGEEPAMEETPEEGTPAEGEEMPASDEGEEMPVEDEGEEEKKDTAMTDSRAFKDAVDRAVEAKMVQAVAIMEKSKTFLDEGYAFAGKTPCQIMKDAVEKVHGRGVFKDSEMEVAFKTLSIMKDYKKFGDSEGVTSFKSLADKEIK